MYKMKIKQLRGVFAVSLTVLSLFFGACDDGKINTVVETQPLKAYMDAHPNLHIFMNNVGNFRESVFLCFYDDDGNSLNQTPLGKYNTGEGVPYGEFTAVELPECEQCDIVSYAYTVDGVSDCATRIDAAIQFPYLEMDIISVESEDSRFYSFIKGYLSTEYGGEDWGNICGDAGDVSCESYAGISTGGVGLVSQPAPEGRTTLQFAPFWDTWVDEEYTLCWDPDNAGSAPSILLTEFPEPYRENWPDYEPITTGTIHLQLGHVDCATADLRDALATAAIPAQMTFGPADGEITFDANTSGTIFIIGSSMEGIPTEAGLRIVPLLHW